MDGGVELVPPPQLANNIRTANAPNGSSEKRHPRISFFTSILHLVTFGIVS
jgi:hypothetical protein